MVKHDLKFGARAVRRIVKDLDKPAALEHDYAVAILDAAKQNAAGRPTPQAQMAADLMVVEGAEIFQRGRDNDPGIEVAMGSEFGSRIYPQFHASPDRGGYWLYPATREHHTINKAEDSLEDVLKAAVRGFGI